MLLTGPTTNGARFQLNTATPNQLTVGGLQGKHLNIPGTGVKGVGVGGLVTAGGFSAIRISIEAAPWTVRTATIPVPTPSGGTATAFAFGYVHGPLSFTATTATTGAGVQLVTPILIRSLDGSDRSGFGVLQLHFIPEPGRLLQLLSTVGVLLVLGRIRMKTH